MPAVTIELPVDPKDGGLPILSPNERHHPRAYHAKVARIRQAVAWRARGAGIPAGLNHITVEAHFQPARPWDDDNVRGAGIWKAAYDALHGRGRGWKHPVVADDTPQYMGKPDPVQHPPVKGGTRRAWLVVSWADAEAEEVVPV